MTICVGLEEPFKYSPSSGSNTDAHHCPFVCHKSKKDRFFTEKSQLKYPALSYQLFNSLFKTKLSLRKNRKIQKQTPRLENRNASLLSVAAISLSSQVL